MSTQKQRRNFRNSKNNCKHKLKQRKDLLDSSERKLEELKSEFNLRLKEVIEFEECNIFCRDDDHTISDIAIENEILNIILIEYESYISEAKSNYSSMENALYTLCAQINENLIHLNNVLTQIDIFYDGIKTEFMNSSKFRMKLIETLHKMERETSIISPLIYGKRIECALKIGIEVSWIYSGIKLEKKQYSAIKKELKKYEHDTLTMTTDNMTPRTPQSPSLASNLYEIRDLKEIEVEINKLRRNKSDSMKILIESVYGDNGAYLMNLCKLKLKQVLIHYQESLIDDKLLKLKLEFELLQIESEELMNELICNEIKKEINLTKQYQLKNMSLIYLNEWNENEKSSKDTERDAAKELKRLQKVEREENKCIHLIKKELQNMDKMYFENNKLIKNKKKKRNKSYNMEFEDKLKINEKERMSFEDELEIMNKEYIEKEKLLKGINEDINLCLINKSELQKKLHQYENHIHSNKYLSQNALRKNNESLEFMAEIEFMNKEYEIKINQINNKYREKETELKNIFINDYNNKIKKNTKHRQSQIEQESYNIIINRKDKEMLLQTQNHIQSNIFRNKSKAVKIQFGKKKLISTNRHHIQHDDLLLNHGLKPIKFECSVSDDEENNDDDQNNDDDAVSDDHDNNNKYTMLNYQQLIHEIDEKNVNIDHLLKNEMDIEQKKDDNDDEYLHFENINMMKQLLRNWSINQ